MMTIWKDLDNSQHKAEQIVQQIRVLIASKELLPGAKLPTQRRLAEHLAVTVGTITRAYALALQQGLVETRTGSGSFVKQNLVREHYWGETKNDSPNLGLFQNTAVDMPRSPKLNTVFSSYRDQDNLVESILNDDFSQSPEAARKVVCEWMGEHQIQLRYEQLFFSYGVQHGLNLSLFALNLVGQSILCEALVYPGLMTLARQLNIRLYPVQLDENGICPDSLERQLEKHHCKALYMTPTLQNPTTAIMPLERRKSIIELCETHKVTIIEDDVCGLLPSSRPPSLVNLAPHLVIHLNGFSKGALKGLRFAFIHCPEHLIEAFKSATRASSWNTSPLLVDLAIQWIAGGYADEALNQQRAILNQRAQLATHLLKGFIYHYQEGSLHLWLELPKPWTSHKFVACAKTQGVDVADAEYFCVDTNAIPNSVRLSLGQVSNNIELEQALSIVRNLLNNPPVERFELM